MPTITDELLKELKNVSDIESFFKSHESQFINETTSSYLTGMLELKNINISSIAKNSGITERLPMRKKDFPTVLNLCESAAKKFIAEIKGKYLIEKSDGLYLSKEYYKGENQKFKRDAKTKLFIDTVQSMYYHMKPSKHKFFGT